MGYLRTLSSLSKLEHMVPSTATSVKPRVRRSVQDARRVILDVAKRRFLEGGPGAVRVQSVAEEVGLTDAAVHYHFGNRAGLMEALLRDAGRRMRDDLEEAAARWDHGTLDIGELADGLRRTLRDEGHGRLTAWMVLGGWKPRGSGMLRPLAENMHHRRLQLRRRGKRPPLEDTLFVVELLGLVVWAESLSGEAWRRSVGLPTDRQSADRFMAWFVDLLVAHLEVGSKPVHD